MQARPKAASSRCASAKAGRWNSIPPTGVSPQKKRGVCCWNLCSRRRKLPDARSLGNQPLCQFRETADLQHWLSLGWNGRAEAVLAEAAIDPRVCQAKLLCGNNVMMDALGSMQHLFFSAAWACDGLVKISQCWLIAFHLLRCDH